MKKRRKNVCVEVASLAQGNHPLHESTLLLGLAEGVHVVDELVPAGLGEDGGLGVGRDAHAVDEALHEREGRGHRVALQARGLHAGEQAGLDVPREVLVDGLRLEEVDEDLGDLLRDSCALVRYCAARASERGLYRSRRPCACQSPARAGCSGGGCSSGMRRSGGRTSLQRPWPRRTRPSRL